MAGQKNWLEKALEAEGITGQLAEVARSIYKQESNEGRNARTSNAGAVGGMQILPGTFAEVADKGWDINDPLLNARAGVRYLKRLDKLAGGDPRLTAAGYYGGPGGMAKARQGVAVSDPRNPKAPNTLQYAEQVASRLPGGSSAPPVAPARAAPVSVAQAGSVDEPIELEPVQYSSPIPAAEPTVVAQAPQDTGPDPWMEFLRNAQAQPVKAEDLAFGPVAQAAPAMRVQAPDFLGMVQGTAGVRPVDFSAFGSWGRRV